MIESEDKIKQFEQYGFNAHKEILRKFCLKADRILCGNTTNNQS